MGSIVVLASGAAAVDFIILLILYFAPSVIAFARSHHNKWAIFALNLLLGWTVLGWIGALVWSLTDQHPNRRRSTSTTTRPSLRTRPRLRQSRLPRCSHFLLRPWVHGHGAEVMHVVLSPGHDLEIADVVVERVVIDVMDDLVGRKWSAEVLLDNSRWTATCLPSSRQYRCP